MGVMVKVMPNLRILKRYTVEQREKTMMMMTMMMMIASMVMLLMLLMMRTLAQAYASLKSIRSYPYSKQWIPSRHLQGNSRAALFGPGVSSRYKYFGQ